MSAIMCIGKNGRLERHVEGDELWVPNPYGQFVIPVNRLSEDCETLICLPVAKGIRVICYTNLSSLARFDQRFGSDEDAIEALENAGILI